MTAKTAHPGIRALLAVAYVVMIATNALANALPINGRTTGGVSDSYPNLFAPTGTTFAIWGVIYILLGAHVLYQMGLFRAPGGREPQAERAMLERVGVLFAAPIAAVLTKRPKAKLGLEAWDEASEIGSPTSPKALAANYWRDKVSAPIEL